MYKPAGQIPAEEDFHYCPAAQEANKYVERTRALPAKWQKNHLHGLCENEKSYHTSAQLEHTVLLTVLHILQTYKHLFPK